MSEAEEGEAPSASPDPVPGGGASAAQDPVPGGGASASPDPVPGGGNSAAQDPAGDAAVPAGAAAPAHPGPVRKWVLGARPRTLPAAIVPVLVGTAVAWWRNGQFRWVAYAPVSESAGTAAGIGGRLSRLGRDMGFGQAFPQDARVDAWRLLLVLVVALAVQVGTNYANDHSDGVRGTDEVRVGPMRLVASGAASARAVMVAAWLVFAVAGVAGLQLAAETTWWLLAVGGACVAAGWLYTGGPKPYGYLGLGELFVFVFFGVVATVGSAFVQEGSFPGGSVMSALYRPSSSPLPSYVFPRNGHIDALAVLVALPVGLLAVALLEANNLRDVSGDTAAGKRTLAVRLGRHRAGWLYVGSLAVVACGVVAVGAVRPWALLALLPAPLAIRPVRLALGDAEGRDLLPMLAATARLQLLMGLLLAVGIVL